MFQHLQKGNHVEGTVRRVPVTDVLPEHSQAFHAACDHGLKQFYSVGKQIYRRYRRVREVPQKGKPERSPPLPTSSNDWCRTPRRKPSTAETRGKSSFFLKWYIFNPARIPTSTMKERSLSVRAFKGIWSISLGISCTFYSPVSPSHIRNCQQGIILTHYIHIFHLFGSSRKCRSILQNDIYTLYLNLDSLLLGHACHQLGDFLAVMIETGCGKLVFGFLWKYIQRSLGGIGEQALGFLSTIEMMGLADADGLSRITGIRTSTAAL